MTEPLEAARLLLRAIDDGVIVECSDQISAVARALLAREQAVAAGVKESLSTLDAAQRLLDYVDETGECEVGYAGAADDVRAVARACLAAVNKESLTTARAGSERADALTRR